MEVCLYYSNCIKQVKSWNIRECQWCNRRVGEDPHPPRLLTGKFLLTYREKTGKEKKGNGAEKKENLKREGGNWKKMKEEKLQNQERGPCIFVCLFVCFVFVFGFFFSTFQNPWNLFWIYQNGNFLPGKSISRREKSGKITLLPLKKYSSYAPWDVLRRNY